MRYKNSKEDIILCMKKVFSDYGQITQTKLNKIYKKYNTCTTGTICFMFGSIENFEKESGLVFKKRKSKLTKNEIIDMMKKVFLQNNKISYVEYNKNYKNYNSCSIGLIRNTFGSIENFEKESGLIFKKTNLKKTKLEIINIIKKNFKQYGIPTQTEFDKNYKKYNCSRSLIYDRFRNIKNFEKESGLKFKSPEIKWTKEKIITCMKNIFLKYGSITLRNLNLNYKKYNVCHNDTIRFMFDSIENFEKESGLKFKKINYNWSKEKIITCIKRVFKKYGSISQEELNKNYDKYNACNIAKICFIFSSIENFEKESRLKFKKISYSWSKEKIINCMKKVFSQYGKITQKTLDRNYKKYGVCDSKVICNIFGSIENFETETKLFFGNIKQKWTKEKVMHCIEKIFEQYGEMTYSSYNKNYKKYNGCSINIIRNTFGSIKIFKKESRIKFKIINYKWSKENIIFNMKKVFLEYGEITQENLDKNYKKYNICYCNTIRNTFGSIENFEKESGLKFKKISKIWTKEKIINIMRIVFLRYGEMTFIEFSKNYKKYNICSHYIIKHNFGSIENFERESGIKFKKRYAWNKGIQHPRKGMKLGTLEERLGKSIALVKRIENSNRQHNRSLDFKTYMINKANNTKIRKGLLKSDDQLIQIIINESKRGIIFTKSELKNFLPISDTRISKMGGIEKIAEQANIVLEKPIRNKQNDRLGKDETKILDHYEKEKNISLQRQVRVSRFFVDGYDPISNTAYEVDEPHHKFQKLQDKLREIQIRNELDCTFVRINEREYLNKIRNKVLGDFR